VKYKTLLAMLLLAAVAHGAKIDPNFPEGWQKMGGGGPDRMRGRCDVGVDKKLAKKGQKNMTVRCDEAIPGFGGLTQGFAADEFRGKRARFSARLMTNNLYDINGVDGVGSLWLRVEGDRPADILIAENLRDRGLKNDTDWTYVDAVMDIPREAGRIRIGFWMQGRGQIWISDVRFEVVDPEVLVNIGTRTTAGPQNLALD
jgi:hypothetical protein